MANASCRVRAQFPGGGFEKLGDDFFCRDFDHALTDGGDDAADVCFAVISDFCFRAFAMKRDSSLPFHESRSTATFDAHFEGFGRIFFRKFDAALEISGESGDAEFHGNLVAIGAVWFEALGARKALREALGIVQEFPNLVALRR